MNKAKKVLYTLAAGAVVGVALGLLFAPEKGIDTRRRLRDLKDKLTGSDIDTDKRALEELSEMLEDDLDMVNRKIKNLT